MPKATSAKIVQGGDCAHAKAHPPRPTSTNRSVPASTGPATLPAPNDENYRHNPSPNSP